MGRRRAPAAAEAGAPALLRLFRFDPPGITLGRTSVERD
jgi:hypothetical protein